MTSESIFWNKHEARLRAGWRLAIQITLNIGLAVSLLALAVYFGGPLASQSPWSNVMVSLMFLGVTLLSVWSAGRFLDKRHFSDFGMLLNRRAWWADFAFGLALGSGLPVGLVLIALATGVATLEPVFTSGMTSVPFVVAVLLSALAFTCIGTFEELARAYHVRNLLEGFNKGVGLKGAMVMAVMGASAVSVLMHRGNTAFLFYVLVSTVVKGLCYLLTSQVAIAMAYHIAWDFVLESMMCFSVLTIVGKDKGDYRTGAYPDSEDFDFLPAFRAHL
ncbi:MAG: hypothetical protein SXV54_03530, partial [Chloroflexota bacterium]|nr:hypothetical protein [Chloroflexota bacterium]